MHPIVKITTAKSQKTGKDYTCLTVKIGDYEGRLFPTPGEVAYIRMLQKDGAHKDFQKEVFNND